MSVVKKGKERKEAKESGDTDDMGEAAQGNEIRRWKAGLGPMGLDSLNV